jgi:hypothetical protein
MMASKDPESLLRGYYRSRLGSLPEPRGKQARKAGGRRDLPAIAFAAAAALALCIAPALAEITEPWPGRDSGFLAAIGGAGIGEAIRGFFAPGHEDPRAGAMKGGEQ